jgi:hypothetical protein
MAKKRKELKKAKKAAKKAFPRFLRSSCAIDPRNKSYLKDGKIG